MNTSLFTFFNKLTTGVLDAWRARFTTASRVRTVPHALFVTATVTLEGIGHGDQRIYNFRCPWCDLGRCRRDTEKTHGSGWTGIHIHVQIVHGLRWALTIYLAWEHQ